MDWQNLIGSVLNSPSFTNLVGGNKQPSAPPSVATPVISVQNPIKESMSSSTMAMIAAGAVAVILGLFFALRK